jgi:hypothetical protein
MTRAEEDALLSDLAEALHHIRDGRWRANWKDRDPIDRAYVAKLLRHALQIVEQQEDQDRA